MRTIKFRGKDIKTNEWAYGDLHTLCDQVHIHTEKTRYPYAGKRSFVVPETIGQFTGLYDKNGKEIYEGDIISRRINGTEKSIWGGVVRQKGAAFVCVNKHDNKYYLDMLFESVLPLDAVVIGNIYDNPELLEKQHC